MAVGEDSIQWLHLDNAEVGVDTRTGGISSLRLAHPRMSFIERTPNAGLVRIAVPLPEYPSHYLEMGTHGSPECTTDGDHIRLVRTGLGSAHRRLAVRVEVDLKVSTDGMVARARVENNSDQIIPQIAFPQLFDLEAVAGLNTRLQFGRERMLPFQELTMRVDDVRVLDRPLQRFVPYGTMASGFNMKWFDYGDPVCGMTVYSRNSRHTSQGLVVDRVNRLTDRLHLRWVHHPFIGPGETWDSGEYVLLVHAGDWHAGARAYQRYAAEKYRYQAPKHIREALGVRSIWPTIRNNPPTFPITEISAFAREIADPNLGLAELIVWHWWVKNGFPIVLDGRLGTEEELVAALARCSEMGVPVSLFVSHHLLRDTDETDPSWMHHNAAGQPIADNWTYGPGFLPRFRPIAFGTHAMVEGSALSPGWRKAGLDSYQRILDYGATSICFDQFGAWRPNLSRAIDGRPDEEGEKLLEFARAARALIHQRSPTGTFAGEGGTDLTVQVLDYTWEWRSGFQVGDAAPFRYVFPQFRLNANVGAHPRGALLAFMDGALLNVMPGEMYSHRLADHPELIACLRQLAALRRRFLPYFTEGQYRHLEGIEITGCAGRLYTLGENGLVVIVNASDAAADVTVSVDPSVWGASWPVWDVGIYTMDGALERGATAVAAGSVHSLTVEPDRLRLLEFVVTNDT